MRICLALSLFLICLAPAVSAAKGRLDKKVTLITGASRGIGKSISKIFAQEGARLVLMARTEEPLKELVDTIKTDKGEAIYVVGDVSKLDHVEKVVQATLKHYGRIDVLVHNAAIFPVQPIEAITEADWHKVLSTNLDSTFYTVKAVIPHMRKQKYGHIVLTSSIGGPRKGLVNKSHYTASKAGMNGFMKTIALEVAKDNITINSVEPSTTLTEGVLKGGKKYIESRNKAIPMGRIGTPDEVAYVHLFLASDESRYVTGQSIIVDGGTTVSRGGLAN